MGRGNMNIEGVGGIKFAKQENSEKQPQSPD